MNDIEWLFCDGNVQWTNGLATNIRHELITENKVVLVK